MKQLKLPVLYAIALAFFFTSCAPKQQTQTASTDSVSTNIKMYTHTWDEIINHGKLDLFNDSNFTTDVIMHIHPDIVGIDSVRAYYANYLTGFSNIQFTGKHTGAFFGIPATGKDVNVEGATLVKMRDGKIAEEQDFFDNLSLMQQLGQIPATTK